MTPPVRAAVRAENSPGKSIVMAAATAVAMIGPTDRGTPVNDESTSYPTRIAVNQRRAIKARLVIAGSWPGCRR